MLDIGNVHFNKLDKLLPFKTIGCFEAQLQAPQQKISLLLEHLDPLIALLLILVIIGQKVTVIEDVLEQIQNVILHWFVLLANHYIEVLYQWTNDEQGQIIADFLFLLNMFENQLEELAC